MFTLQDKTIVITGATGVLGSAFVQALAEAHANIVLLARTKQKCETVAQALRQQGFSALAVVADVTVQEELEEAKHRVVEQFGRIDGLVNAAGGNIPEAVVQNDKDVFELDMAAMRKVMDINLFGSLLPIQIFGRQMAKQKCGSIVNISSLSSKRTLTKVLGYSMAKATIDIYTKWMAVEIANRYGNNIRINAITPGFFLTEQNKKLLRNEDGGLTERGNTIIQHTPYKRFGQPNELNGALLYLLSDASAFVTGTELVVDGGFSAFSGV